MNRRVIAAVAIVVTAGYGGFTSVRMARLSHRVALLEAAAARHPEEFSRADVTRMQKRVDELERQVAQISDFLSRESTKRLLDTRAIRDLPTESSRR